MPLTYFSAGTMNRLYSPSEEQKDELNRFLLDNDLKALEKRVYHPPTKYYLDGPNCNYQPCGYRGIQSSHKLKKSNSKLKSKLNSKQKNNRSSKNTKSRASLLQGCGNDCTCVDYGSYGWRCIPKCCIRAEGARPCRFEHPGQTIQCALPYGYYPMDFTEYAFNPYHKWQGGYKVSPNYPGIVPSGD